MNLLLFETPCEEVLLSQDDPRYDHVLRVLKRVPGDQLDVASVNGPKGKATVVREDSTGLLLSFVWEGEFHDDRFPIHLVAGLPRPQTARKILEQAASMGVRRMTFFGSDKGEPSYADSKLWMTEEWRRHLLRGVEQAFCSFLPEVSVIDNLEEALGPLHCEAGRIALDVYEADRNLSSIDARAAPMVLAVGPERGWSKRERQLLRDGNFLIRGLGSRVLREETAVVAALGVLASPHWQEL